MAYNPVSGKNVSIFVAGTPTLATTAGCDESTNVATITDITKRIIDPATAVIVYDGGVEQAADTYTVNYLFGTITKNSGNWAGAVTVTYKYIPTVQVIVGKSASLTFSTSTADTTVLGDTAMRKTSLFRGLTGSLETIALDNFDLTAASSVTFASLSALEYSLFEFRLGPTYAMRAFVSMDTRTANMPLEDIARTTLNFQGTLVDPVGASRLGAETIWSFGAYA